MSMMSVKNSYKIYSIVLILFVVFVDQFSKYYMQSLEYSEIFICYLCSFVHIWNSGVSFGMFSDFEAGRILLSIVTGMIIAFLFYWLYKESDNTKMLSLSLIIGGALGNLIDRVRVGAVYDFIDLHYNSWHWPAFNLADTCIVLGVLLLFVKEWRNEKN